MIGGKSDSANRPHQSLQILTRCLASLRFAHCVRRSSPRLFAWMCFL